MSKIPEHLATIFDPTLIEEVKYLEYLYLTDNAMTSKRTQLVVPDMRGNKLSDQRLYKIADVDVRYRKMPVVSDVFFLKGTQLYTDSALHDANISGGTIDSKNAQIALFTTIHKVFASASLGNEESQAAYAMLHIAGVEGKKIAFIRSHGVTSPRTGMLSLTSDPYSLRDEVSLPEILKDLAESKKYALILVDACNSDAAFVDTTGVDIPVVVPITKSGITSQRSAREHQFKVYMPAA